MEKEWIKEAENAKRILIIGSPGSGKSTLGRKLSSLLNLPLVHLDLIWHKADGTNISKEAFDQRLECELEKEAWIMDGNYKRTLKQRLQYADLVIWLDLPVKDCLKGARARIGKKRTDLPWIEKEFDPEFESYIQSFDKEQKPTIIAFLKEYPNIPVIILYSHQDADDLIAGLEKSRQSQDASE